MYKIHFTSSNAPLALSACNELILKYGNHTAENADVIVAIGGDGTMLETIHKYMRLEKSIYGMNRGHIGFLMNDFSIDDLHDRLNDATLTAVHPLKATGTTIDGDTFEYLAINDVSITRQNSQAAKLRISVDGKVKMEELIGDGLIVSTPVGSTAYNRSAGGPILPLEAPTIAVTPICAFRPRHWKGAILPDHLVVEVEVLEETHRRVSIAVDSKEVKDVVRVKVTPERSKLINILCDPNRSWSDKLLNEQFCW